MACEQRSQDRLRRPLSPVQCTTADAVTALESHKGAPPTEAYPAASKTACDFGNGAETAPTNAHGAPAAMPALHCELQPSRRAALEAQVQLRQQAPDEQHSALLAPQATHHVPAPDNVAEQLQHWQDILAACVALQKCTEAKVWLGTDTP